MAETLVKNQVCGACGSDVRPNSLFCYHCGSALEAVEEEEEKNETATDEPSDVWFRSEIAAAPAKEEEVKKNKDDKADEIVEDKIKTAEARRDKFKSGDLKKIDKDTKSVEKEDSSEEEDTVEQDQKQDKKAKKAGEVLEKEEDSKVSVKPKPYKERSKKRSRKGKIEVSNRIEKVDGARLRSAAALRKREKPARLKRVEIVWEERESSPNIWFIIIALFLGLAVAGLVVLSVYLK